MIDLQQLNTIVSITFIILRYFYFAKLTNIIAKKITEGLRLVFPTVAIHIYRSSPLVPLDSCLTAAACLSSA